MIKLRFNGRSRDGKLVVGLGLSRANCEKMLSGDYPIPVDLAELLPANTLAKDVTVVLFAGETEDAITLGMIERGWIGSATKLHSTPRDGPMSED